MPIQLRNLEWTRIAAYASIIWFLAGLAAVHAADALILELRNGDRLTGLLERESALEVVITNDIIGRITVPAGEIKERKRLTIPAGTTAAAATNAPAKSPPLAAPKPPAPPKVKQWTFDLQLGVNLQYNQQENELYYGSAKVNYTPVLRLRNVLDYKVNYGRTEGFTSANNMRGSMRTEYDVTRNKRLFLFNEGGAGYDEIRRIDFTYDDSLGVGYKLLQLTNFVMSVDTGANYQEQHFSDGTRKEDFAIRFGEKISWKISPRFNLDESLEFYLRSVDVDDYRVRFESNLRYLLNSHLTLNVTVMDIYDTNPAPGVTPNDLQIRSTVGVRF